MTTPEPRDAWEQRFYDRANQIAERRAAKDGSELVAAGIGAAILFPLAGVVVGIVLLFKERVGSGLGCILLSVLAMAVYYVLLTA